jgi:hypothetical protein
VFICPENLLNRGADANYPVVDQVYASSSQNFVPVQHPPQQIPPGNAISTPTTSAASPVSIDLPQQHPNWQGGVGSGGLPDPSSHLPYSQQLAATRLFNQQRHDLRHGLDLGPERLGLDFLLDASQRIPKMESGLNGAQDSPQFQHVPMKHDWTGVHALRGSATSSPGSGIHVGGGANSGLPLPPAPPPPPGLEYGGQDNTASATGYSVSDGAGGSGGGGGEELAGYSAPIMNCGATCPLDALLLDFLNERRQRAAEGLSPQEIIGPRYPSVSSLLNPSNRRYSHPLSKVFTDILSKFPDISALPERVAVLYIMFLIMRWQIAPTQENYDRLPEWAAPRPSQLFTSHPAWIDHLPFPRMREKLVRDYNPRDYLFDNFFIPFTTTLSLNWKYEDTDTLLQNPDSDELMINPVFERHLRRLENWTLGDAFAKTFPTLAGTYNLKSESGGDERGDGQQASSQRR